MKKICALLLTLCLLLSLSACGAPKTYEVRFELNGGTLVSGELLQKIESGGSAALPVAERDGYILGGWSGETGNVTDNIVSVAQWVKLYTVTFDPAGGELSAGEAEQRVAEGELPQEPTVERRFAAFDGWEPAIEAAKGDATYTAKWKHTTLSPEDLYEYISPAVVELQVFDINDQQFALGSGFFIDDAGTLVTNYHVIEAAYSAKAQLSDGSSADIRLVKAYDPELDLAILQADLSGNDFLRFSETGVKTGETVYALGSSRGLTGSFSEGIVSTASREIDGVVCIQTTAPISQGNSGGPLVDNYGEVVGINSMSMELGQNLNFAIDIKELDKLDPSLTLSLPDFYEETAPEISTEELSGYWYDYADNTEVESNDTIWLADPYYNGEWVAGEINNEDDIDCFYIQLESAAEVLFVAAPYFKDDMPYFSVEIYRLGDEDLEYVTDLDSFEAASGQFIHSVSFGKAASVHLDAGTYFAALYLEESYWSHYNEPSYYLAKAEW